MNESLPLFPEDLPVYEEDLKKIKEKKKSINCLQDMLIELMAGDVDEFGRVKPGGRKPSTFADIHKATGIHFTTLHFWYYGQTNAQLADENLLKLARYFNVSLEYLCFGIGSDEPYFEKFEDKKAAQ